jgi:hypothetical protein
VFHPTAEVQKAAARIAELQRALEWKGKLVFNGGVYWTEDGDALCSAYWDDRHKLPRMATVEPIRGKEVRPWTCPSC